MKAYQFNRKTFLSPYLILVAIIVYAIYIKNYWGLLSLPIVYLGWITSTPNFNFIDGLLPILSSIIFGILGASLSEVFYIFSVVSLGSWIIISIEAIFRTKEVEIEGENTEPAD